MADDEKKRQADLKSARSQKSYKEQQLSAAKKKNAEIDRKVSRLESARSKIKTQRSNYSDIKRETRSELKDKLHWKGQQNSLYKSNGETLKTEDENYYNGLGNILRAIDDEIVRLNNQRYSESWLAQLGRDIYNLGVKIRKLLTF
ncbi:protein of unknown function [Lachnospiraceae bacterium NE2001]|nr:protein of unknown function [Lachnospiraceae bacterium NE2001]